MAISSHLEHSQVNDDRGPGWVVEEGGEVRGAVVAGVGGCRSRGGGGEDW